MAITHGVSAYFDQNNHGEQDLTEDLIIESISIFGQEMFYMPRTLVAYDPILGEDASSAYTQAIPFAMYIRSVDGFEGDGNFMSKFGLQIQDQVQFTFSKRIWEEEVGAVTGNIRPNEGDLIFFPLNAKLFQIQYVNYKPFFYQQGVLPTYDVTCILFSYSNETISTGIPQIDQIVTHFSTNIIDFTILDEAGNPIRDENGDYIVQEAYADHDATIPADNVPIQTEEDTKNYLNWSEIDPFANSHY